LYQKWQIKLQKLLKIDEIQATAILDMQLRKLAALERQKITPASQRTSPRHGEEFVSAQLLEDGLRHLLVFFDIAVLLRLVNEFSFP